MIEGRTLVVRVVGVILCASIAGGVPQRFGASSSQCGSGQSDRRDARTAGAARGHSQAEDRHPACRTAGQRHRGGKVRHLHQPDEKAFCRPVIPSATAPSSRTCCGPAAPTTSRSGGRSTRIYRRLLAWSSAAPEPLPPVPQQDGGAGRIRSRNPRTSSAVPKPSSSGRLTIVDKDSWRALHGVASPCDQQDYERFS